MTTNSAHLRSITLRKQIIITALILNVVVVLYFWLANNYQYLGGDSGQTLTSFGRLLGLLATTAALLQFIIMSRAGWLESVFGMDKLAIFHRLNGYAAFIFITLHPIFISNGYALTAGIGYAQQIVQLFYLHPSMPLAFLASVLFTFVVATSMYIVRRKLKFEAWYYLHLLVYVAIVAGFFHQVTLGSDLLSDAIFRYYWYILYLFVIIQLATSRFARIPFLYLKHRFAVDRVTPETADASSVYIKGRNFASFDAKGGQFVLVRFLRPGMWWQEHPFSLSSVKTNDHGFRLTIKQLGDYTAQIPGIKPGTKVLISGPFGVFTNERSYHDKKLFIAGGIGITPIYSMLEESHNNGSLNDAVLLYGNKKMSDTVFKEELERIADKKQLRVHHVLSTEKVGGVERGYIDEEKIRRLVGDIRDRDIYICGPSALLNSVLDCLKRMDIDSRYIHYEAFSLHQ